MNYYMARCELNRRLIELSRRKGHRYLSAVAIRLVPWSSFLPDQRSYRQFSGKARPRAVFPEWRDCGVSQLRYPCRLLPMLLLAFQCVRLPLPFGNQKLVGNEGSTLPTAGFVCWIFLCTLAKTR